MFELHLGKCSMTFWTALAVGLIAWLAAGLLLTDKRWNPPDTDEEWTDRQI